MSPELHFNHAKRRIHINTSFEVNTNGELVMTDGTLNSLTERHIAHNALIYLLNMSNLNYDRKPVLNHDFTVEEMGTNASQDDRHFRVTIKPPYAALAVDILRDKYFIEDSEIKGLENL